MGGCSSSRRPGTHLTGLEVEGRGQPLRVWFPVPTQRHPTVCNPSNCWLHRLASLGTRHTYVHTGRQDTHEIKAEYETQGPEVTGLHATTLPCGRQQTPSTEKITEPTLPCRRGSVSPSGHEEASRACAIHSLIPSLTGAPSSTRHDNCPHLSLRRPLRAHCWLASSAPQKLLSIGNMNLN